MAVFEAVKLEKSMYQCGEDFCSQLERVDPSAAYTGTALEGLSAFERQLKRFDIRVSGKHSDRVEKFFRTGDSALLFPAYVNQAVAQGMEHGEILEQILAAHTNIDAMDYRSITTVAGADGDEIGEVLEGGFIPETTIALQDHLVQLKKRGRMLRASYEAIRFQRLDLFSVALRQIGAYIARSQLKDAVKVLIEGDGNENPAKVLKTAGSSLAYEDLCKLWAQFEEFEMNVLLAAPDMANQLLSLPELRSMGDGNRFTAPNVFATPFGAALIKSNAVPAGKIIALDRRCALEMVTAGELQTDYDKLIDCQMERVVISDVSGFAKLFPEAVRVLELNA